MNGPAGSLRGLIVDLDDTLYPQAAFLAEAWAAVAAGAPDAGLDPTALHRALVAAAALGSDRGGIIDRAVAAVGGPASAVGPLVARFHAVVPRQLSTYPGVADGLARLRGRIGIAVLTDGLPDQQRAKLHATGLAPLVDVVICTDDEGRARRKPHAAGFERALAALGVAPHQAVVVGDRPDKDVAGAVGCGIAAIRVRQGEHEAQPDGWAWRSCRTTAEALGIVEALLPAPSTAGAAR